MARKNPHEDLSDRLVGQRFYSTKIDEAFTVIGVSTDNLFVYIQYDDGTSWDEMASPDVFSKEKAAAFGVEEGGIESATYRPLGSGPTIENACEEGEHRWFPRPSELFRGDANHWEDIDESTYFQMIRCKKCGLSGDVASGFLGHLLPKRCDRCGTELIPGEDDFSWGVTPDWEDHTLCEPCITEVKEAE